MDTLTLPSTIRSVNSGSDLSAVYITANRISKHFGRNTRRQLLLALSSAPLISVSHRPMDFGFNICVDLPRSQASIYRQVLIGAKEAKTDYIAVCEDDILYSPEHFKFRPKDNHWGYNMNSWSIFTWGEPMFTYKAPGGRRGLHGLICQRDLLIKHLEERFKLHPGEVNISIFGEPGKYDNQLGTTPYPSEFFYINPPNIVFSHQESLQFVGLGTRKRTGNIRARAVPYWGTAERVLENYEPLA